MLHLLYLNIKAPKKICLCRALQTGGNVRLDGRSIILVIVS